MNQIDRSLTIIQRLRDPENGCPQDKEQIFATTAPYTLEETYETLDAVAHEDFDGLRGELGDPLFRVVFYARITQGEERFNSNDIYVATNDRLERRHSHIFADSSTENSNEVLAYWEQIKTEERVQKARHSVLDNIPRSLPALMRVQKIQRRCANVGFDWMTLGPVVGKVYEEVDEVMYEVRQAVVDQARLEERMGDLLLVMVNLAHHLGTKAEIVLWKANEGLERRLREVEHIVVTRGLEMTDADLETMGEA